MTEYHTDSLIQRDRFQAYLSLRSMDVQKKKGGGRYGNHLWGGHDLDLFLGLVPGNLLSGRNLSC